MDTELDQVLCTVLSLEEDYPTMSPPPRFQDNFFSSLRESPDVFSATESQRDLQNPISLQQKLLEIYTLIGLQREARAKKMIIPEGTMTKDTNNQNPLKRKLEVDESEGCKHSRVEIEDLQNDNQVKRCRKRTNYNKEQINFLMKEFDRNPYPDFTRRCRIATITGISEPRIQVWFQNRRARHLSKPTKPQNLQSRQFSKTEDLANIFYEEYPHLQINRNFEIPENMWIH